MTEVWKSLQKQWLELTDEPHNIGYDGTSVSTYALGIKIQKERERRGVVWYADEGYERGYRETIRKYNDLNQQLGIQSYLCEDSCITINGHNILFHYEELLKEVAKIETVLRRNR